jgi:hypothetical protein
MAPLRFLADLFKDWKRAEIISLTGALAGIGSFIINFTLHIVSHWPLLIALGLFLVGAVVALIALPFNVEPLDVELEDDFEDAMNSGCACRQLRAWKESERALQYVQSLSLAEKIALSAEFRRQQALRGIPEPCVLAAHA